MTVMWLTTALRQLAQLLIELEEYASKQTADSLQTKIDKNQTSRDSSRSVRFGLCSWHTRIGRNGQWGVSLPSQAEEKSGRDSANA